MVTKTVEVQGTTGSGFAIEINCDSHKVIIDQPAVAGGTDKGTTPLHLMLAALGGCFGTIGKFVAHQQKIELRGMRFTVQADYDPAGLLGRDPSVRPGFQDIRFLVDIDADLSLDEKKAFLQEVESRCPLVDNLLHGTRIHSDIVTA